MTPQLPRLADRVPSLHPVSVLHGRRQRRARPADEGAAYQRLHETLIRSPETLFQALCEAARELFQVETAGVSLLETHPEGDVFRWVAVDGRYAGAVGQTLPRYASPCGHVLARNAPLLLTDPLEDFPVYEGTDPPIVEALLAPFHADGVAIGTLWLVLHRPGEQFDESDAQQLARLSQFGALAHHFGRGARRAAEREATHRYVLALADRLRALTDPEEIKYEAACAIGRYLKINRVAYAENNAGSDCVTLSRGYTDGVPDIVGRHPYTGYGRSMLSELQAGRTVIRRDIPTDPSLTPSEKQAYREVELAALIAVPLVKGGQLVGILTAQSRDPRDWSVEDIAAVEATAERTWDAVERARAAQAQGAAEQSARDSAALFKQVVNVDGVGFIVLDPASGVVLDANDAFLRMLGYTREQIAARTLTWRTLTPPEYLEQSAVQVANLHATGRIGPYEKEYYRADGSRSWMLFAGARLGDGTVGEYCIDINDRKRAEAALHENDRRKDEFLAMLAHELRNPLSSIANASELLRRVAGELPQAGLPLAVLGRQIAQLTRLVDDLLDVSRIARGQITLERSPIGIDGVIDAAVEAVEPLLREKSHRLQVSRPLAPLYVCGDRARLVQALSNVLHNAAKYTDCGGDIQLEVAALPEELTIRVRDNGAGISPELLPQVFDLFTQSDRTLDRSQGGLGIGLCVVRRLVEMHGGVVTASSAGPRQGSTFLIQLPRVEGPEAAAEVQLPGRGDARRVLVVDDNADSADSLAMLLRSDGHDVVTAYGAAQALEAANGFKPDVIFLDIGLPHMDGYEVARRLRARQEPSLRRLVALTGYGQQEDHARALAAGFDDHLAKPAHPDAISRVLDVG